LHRSNGRILFFFDHAWIGPSDTIQSFHVDHHTESVMNENLFIKIEGWKYVAVAGPEDSPVFLERPIESGYHRHSLASPFDARIIAQCRSLSHCVLAPGDALLIPKGYWHYLQSITPSVSISRWWFACPTAETLYSAACRDERACDAAVRRTCWRRDLATFGGKEHLARLLSQLSTTERYASILWLERRYGEGVMFYD
jgi:hypothetical protein